MRQASSSICSAMGSDSSAALPVVAALRQSDTVVSPSQTTNWLAFLSAGGIHPKLSVSAPGDADEREADAVAERVMRMAAPAAVPIGHAENQVHRKCAACADDDKDVVARKADGAGVKPGVGAQGIPALSGLGGGTPLPAQERAFFEPRFGSDLSAVRIHAGSAGNRASRAIGARAFAMGTDVGFARGEYRPGTREGRHLMAHELAHVMDKRISSGPARILRKPAEIAPPDPLCAGISSTGVISTAEQRCNELAAKTGAENRMKLVQALKMIRRCSTDDEKTKMQSYLETKLGATSATEIWDEAGTAFGGYRGVYPGFYQGAKRLNNLGVKEAEGFKPFDYPEPEIDDKLFSPRGKKSAKAMASTMEATDILYFYGHQYAQYGNPGAFANGKQDKFVDLRKLKGNGNFDRVKLIISTSCATICKEAIEVFTALFPNAVILGFRKSAPLEGEILRNDFEKAILGLKKPLLLNQAVDVAAIIDAWKSVIVKTYPNEAERLPGYFQGGTVYFLKNGKWDSMKGDSKDNSCKKKGTEIQQARQH